MELEASICSKCGSKGLAPKGTDKCFCGGNMIVFPVTKDQYIKMSDYEINQMIEQMNIHPSISKDDALTIYNITHSTETIDAMIELKQKDIIEYGLKLSQFKNQLEQKRQVNQQERNQVRCPKCGSTSITTGARGVNLTFGLLGASKTVNRCGKCGYTWKP